MVDLISCKMVVSNNNLLSQYQFILRLIVILKF